MSKKYVINDLGKEKEIMLDLDINNKEQVKKDQEKINEVLFEHLSKLKQFSNREYLLQRKFYELKEFITNVKYTDIMIQKSIIMDKDDIKEFVDKMNQENGIMEIQNDIKIENVSFSGDNNKIKLWSILRKFISVLYWEQNPGRNVKYLVWYKNKILGIISLGSDVMSLEQRDKYIGWDKVNNEIKFNKLRNTQIQSTIVQVQPFSYLLNGGKLLSILLYNDVFKIDWYSKYKDHLVGITTTSLFGIQNSQYNGMQKYWKPLGESKGLIPIHPFDYVYNIMRDYLKTYYKKELEKEEQRTGPKQNQINLYYKVSEFKSIWKSKSNMKIKDLNFLFNRGIYFQEFYDKTKEFLRNEVEQEELNQRQSLDIRKYLTPKEIERLDKLNQLSYNNKELNSLIHNETQDIIRYWWNKYQINRWETKGKYEIDNRDIFFMDEIYSIDDVNKFIEKFK